MFECRPTYEPITCTYTSHTGCLWSSTVVVWEDGVGDVSCRTSLDWGTVPRAQESITEHTGSIELVGNNHVYVHTYIIINSTCMYNYILYIAHCTLHIYYIYVCTQCMYIYIHLHTIIFQPALIISRVFLSLISLKELPLHNNHIYTQIHNRNCVLGNVMICTCDVSL